MFPVVTENDERDARKPKILNNSRYTRSITAYLYVQTKNCYMEAKKLYMPLLVRIHMSDEKQDMQII